MIFCIGNGESRQKIDLHFLKKYGTIYGSNALYRDFTSDNLIVTDPDMLDEVIKSGYTRENKVWTTEYSLSKFSDLLEKIPKVHKIYMMPFERVHPVNSGWMSIRLAWEHFHSEHQIYLIGFDLFGERKNIYDGTNNYGTISNRGVSVVKEYDIQENERIGLFYLLKEEFCPGIRLTRVIDDNSKVENIDNITTEQFLKEIEWQ